MDSGEIRKAYGLSIKQSVGVSTLRQAMNKDVIAVNSLLKAMEASNPRGMENSITPYKGGTVDVSV